MTFCHGAPKFIKRELRHHIFDLVKNRGARRSSLCQVRWCSRAAEPLAVKLSWADRLRGFLEENQMVSESSSDGWLYGYALDGKGGARKLEPWDGQVCDYLSRMQKQDGDVKGDSDVICEDDEGMVKGDGEEGDVKGDTDVKGFWIHIDFTRAKNVRWVWDVVQSIGRTDALVDSVESEDYMRIEDMRTLWLSRLAENDRVSLPRCEISSHSDALFLSFRVGHLASSSSAGIVPYRMNVRELRVCLTKHLLLTTRISQSDEHIRMLPEVESSLLEGRGGKSCGELVAILVDRSTAKSAAAARDAYESILKLRTTFQGKSLALKGNRPIGRKELAELSRKLSHVRYDATRLSRNLTQQKDALQMLYRFANKRKQKVFSRADAIRCRQAFERQDVLEETLDDVDDSAEVLHGEIMTHINWGTAESTYRLTILGGICSVFIIINIVACLSEFSERQKLNLQYKNSKYLDHYFKVNNIS